MPEMTAQELQDLAAHQARKINELEAAETRRTLDADLTAAIAATGAKVAPGTEGQLLDLLRPTVSTYSDASGRRQFGGPSFTDLKSHVAAQLAGSLRHFVGGSSPTAPTSSPASAGSLERGPNESPVEYMTRWSSQQKATSTDPRLDPSKGLALPAGNPFKRHGHDGVPPWAR